ncbi:MAG: TonB-dependent receptor plug domain-containing protein [Muribaculaceae bacterium]|nr:TonB-dependent receptor plug domain-containing protein [Muribaculaceae bacterium]
MIKYRLWFATAGALAALSATAEAPVALRGITATARSPREIGAEVTRIDSAMLRTSPAQSMADVLTFGSSGYIKSYGRASVSTLTFRGTSPSHTAVTWNGMRISSPMLGSTDFSTIPSYMIDGTRLLHGSSSLSETGGGIGGLVSLTSAAWRSDDDRAFRLQAVQGLGSWSTSDSYLMAGWNSERVSITARMTYARSDNDFKYTNYEKKENIYGPDHEIIDSYYPTERNRNAAFHDLNAMLSVAADGGRTGSWSLDAWWTDSDRQLPLMTTDYSSSNLGFENKQSEHTLRAIGRWTKSFPDLTLRAAAGTVISDLHYDSSHELGAGLTSVLTRSITRQRSGYVSGSASWIPGSTLIINADAEFYYHHTSSADFAPVAGAVSYEGSRPELGIALAARWRPSNRTGLGAILREEFHGSMISVPIPALFGEYLIIPKAQLLVKVSGSRNYRVPTLNDLYTVPGGNPDLRTENGWTGDLSLSAATPRDTPVRISGSAGIFGSRITDWIQWLPSPRGYYVPRNVRRVDASGFEASADALWAHAGWTLSLKASYTFSRSINRGEPLGAGDMSVGRQLPYVPLHAASGTFRVAWREWQMVYMIQGYSRRYALSSNAVTPGADLAAYSVSNLTVERPITIRNVTLRPKIAVNNIFNTRYRTVLSRPMPGINFEAFLGVEF